MMSAFIATNTTTRRTKLGVVVTGVYFKEGGRGGVQGQNQKSEEEGDEKISARAQPLSKPTTTHD